MKRKRGRPKLNDSETKLRTYKISERDYQSFVEWCTSRGFKPCTVVRSLIINYTVQNMLGELKENLQC